MFFFLPVFLGRVGPPWRARVDWTTVVPGGSTFAIDVAVELEVEQGRRDAAYK